MISDVDKAAFAATVRQGLESCQAQLLADLSAIITKQHETLLQNLVVQLNGPSLGDSANTAKPEPPEFSSISPAILPQSGKVLTATDQKLQLMESKDEEPKQMPTETVEMVEDDATFENDSEVEPVEVRTDAGFSSIFAAQDMNETDLEEPRYHVEDLYSEEGCAQALARNSHFSNVTLGIIALNAVYIGMDADWNTAEILYDANPFFIFMDNAFCTFFSFELLVRFLAFKRKRDSLRDGWFKFDSFLVLIMVMETWVMAPAVALASGGGVAIPVQPLRLLRLLRLTRMTRLMRSLPELVTMTKGMKVASRAVFSSLFMVALLIYTFAIVLNMFLKENGEINEALAPRNFETIPRTMWTLLMDGTFMDNTGKVLTELLFSNEFACWLSCLCFMVFILFSAITIMNMLIGVLCEVVSGVGKAEKDEADIALAKQSVLVNLKRFEGAEGKISKNDLERVFKDKQAKVVLKTLNIDHLFLTELQQLMFPKPDSRVSIKAIMELMLMCRGDLAVTVQHIASAQAALLMSMEKKDAALHSELEGMRSEISLLSAHCQTLTAGKQMAHEPPTNICEQVADRPPTHICKQVSL